MSSPPVPSRPVGAREWLGIYAALQIGAAFPLALAFVLLVVLQPIGARSGDGFLRSWLASFVLVPLTYVPALVVWHAWVLRRCGRHPRMVRLLAELVFAIEFVGCVLYQRIA